MLNKPVFNTAIQIQADICNHWENKKNALQENKSEIISSVWLPKLIQYTQQSTLNTSQHSQETQKQEYHHANIQTISGRVKIWIITETAHALNK